MDFNNKHCVFKDNHVPESHLWFATVPNGIIRKFDTWHEAIQFAWTDATFNSLAN